MATPANREKLKGYFLTNMIPSEAHFSDLIDMQVNVQDDGIVKRVGDDEPLGLIAARKNANQQNVLRLYATAPTGGSGPDWLVALADNGDLKIAKSTGEGAVTVSELKAKKVTLGTGKYWFEERTGPRPEIYLPGIYICFKDDNNVTQILGRVATDT